MNSKIHKCENELICDVTFQMLKELLQPLLQPLRWRKAFLKHICKISVLSYRYIAGDVLYFNNIISVLTALIKLCYRVELFLLLSTFLLSTLRRSSFVFKNTRHLGNSPPHPRKKKNVFTENVSVSSSHRVTYKYSVRYQIKLLKDPKKNVLMHLIWSACALFSFSFHFLCSDTVPQSSGTKHQLLHWLKTNALKP